MTHVLFHSCTVVFFDTAGGISSEWVSFAFGTFSLLISGVLVLVLQLRADKQTRYREGVEKQLKELSDNATKHGREIRDTRSAIARIEGKLDLEPFRYTAD
jgi:hypothetical protein